MMSATSENNSDKTVGVLVDLLIGPLFERLKPLIDDYFEDKSKEDRDHAWPEYIQRTDIEKYTGFSKSTFDRWVRDGLPIVKGDGNNGRVMVRSSDLRSWLDKKMI